MVTRAVLFAAIVLEGSHQAQAQRVDWTLRTADFTSRTVLLQSFDQAGLKFKSAEAAPLETLPTERFLSIARPSVPVNSANPAGLILITRRGERIPGIPESMKGDDLVWQSDALGTLTLPMRGVVAIARAAVKDSPKARAGSGATNEDVISLLNGDAVRGIVAGIDKSNLTVQNAAGERTDVAIDSISRIDFTSAAAAGTDVERAGDRRASFLVSLADGSRIDVRSVELASAADGKCSMTLVNGEKRDAPANQLVGIEQVDGPVVWLSALSPVESVQTPFLDRAWPLAIDRAVDGAPLRLGDQLVEHGFGVHSYSRLVFDLDPAFKGFRTDYSIASRDLPLADVTVRIKLDDRVVFEEANVTSSRIGSSSPVLVPLDGNAKRLTLEVDYGQRQDVQDRFNWIEPALLKTAPSTAAPSTNPSH